MPASIELVRAGNWVFGTGLRAGNPRQLFQSLAEKLNQAGSSISRVVRLDQYYPHVRCVAPYQAARKQAFERRQVAPSTSVIVSALQDPQAEVDVQIMAASSASGHVLQEIGAGLSRPDTSGYAPCLRAGDLVFVAGQLARDAAGGLAAQGVAAETAYIFQERLMPALEAAGSSPQLVLKAQVYLSRAQDVADFHRSWARLFGSGVPPTTVVSLRHPAFLTAQASVEINLIGAHRSAAARVRRIGGDHAQARMLDGLLFVGGLSGGDVEEAMQKAEPIFTAAGTGLSNIVRALVFHSGGRCLPDEPPRFPVTALEAESGLTVDLWGYAPQP